MYTLTITWSAEDVVNAFENHGITISLAKAEEWLKAHEKGIHDTMTEQGNEIFSDAVGNYLFLKKNGIDG